MSSDAGGEQLWEPSSRSKARATMTRYMQWLAENDGLGLDTYEKLWRWSVDDVEAFWASVWSFFRVRASTPYTSVLDSHEMPGTRWFQGATLNYAEHVLSGSLRDGAAIVHAAERRPPSAISWSELHRQTAFAAAGLRQLGVRPGDRVAAYITNIPEAVIAFLACASLGATWSSCSPDFGTRSVVDRFAQIEPVVLLAIDGYRYGGRNVDRMATVVELQQALPTVRHTVLVPNLDESADPSRLRDAISWQRMLRGAVSQSGLHGEVIEEAPRLDYEQVPFDHPLWILYSSGTTGLPKAIVHGHGGIVLEHLKKLHLHFDLHHEDRVFWYTTTGWMMWNLLVGGLLTGASIVLYDGSPTYPNLDVLWGLAERVGITCFGTSAGFLQTCMKAGLTPGRGRDLRRLRSVGSTGSPLSADAYRWVYGSVKQDVWLFSTSGGTDVCTAFVGGCPLLPVNAGELQCRSLGAAVEAFDDRGRPVIDRVGELVLTEPMPSMPLYLWNDPDGQRYRASYFATYPGVWRHGDWIRITKRGTAVISGRSDATLNRHGVRLGSGEIYRAVARVPEVVDSLVVDVERPDGKPWMPLFVVLADGARLDDDLRERIRARIREDCSPRHVPDEIRQIVETPRTLSGKLVEVPVKRILMGATAEEAVSPGSLANPEALEPFVEMALELRDT